MSNSRNAGPMWGLSRAAGARRTRRKRDFFAAFFGRIAMG
jgi:hypothetical protein